MEENEILKVCFLLLTLQWPQKLYWTLKAHLNINMSLHYLHNSKSSSFCFQEIQYKYRFQARLVTFFFFYMNIDVKKYLDTLCLYFWAIVYSKIPWFSKHLHTISTQAYTLCLICVYYCVKLLFIFLIRYGIFDFRKSISLLSCYLILNFVNQIFKM